MSARVPSPVSCPGMNPWAGAASVTRSPPMRAAHVERARYHAHLARRRYLAVDPPTG